LTLVGGGTATSAEPRNCSQGDDATALTRSRTALRTYSAIVSLSLAAACSHLAFSPSANRMVSMSLMSAVSHRLRTLSIGSLNHKADVLSKWDRICEA
jgi:hypothetical protein